MRRTAALGVVILGLAGLVSAASGQNAPIVFSAMGDIPYGTGELPILQQQVRDHNKYSPSAFVVHIGDIKSGSQACTDSWNRTVADILKGFAVPCFIIPGDNEYNDCSNPTQAWGYWVQNFNDFEKNFCGAGGVQRQSVRHENFAFVRNGVLFVGINLVGGAVHSQAEWNLRLPQDADWVKQQLQENASLVRAAVIFGHTDPGNTDAKLFFDPFRTAAAAFAKPILYIHGDHHTFMYDHPLPEQNVTRMEVDNGAAEDPVQITVSLNAQNPWSYVRNPFHVSNPQIVNMAPCVEAGPDQTISLPASASLSARATDDGDPVVPGSLTLTWTKVSGPGPVAFGNLHAAQTTATMTVGGAYVLRLTASDGQYDASDDITVVASGGGPMLSVSDATVTEGDAGTVAAQFTVTLLGGTGAAVSVAYATGGGTATSGVDFDSTSGTLNFSGSTTTSSFTVNVRGDLTYEGSESFFVNLSSASGAGLSNGQGVGTILENDPAPQPSVASFTPGSGVLGTDVTVNGSNFAGASSVSFNGVTSAFSVQSGAVIRATVPAGASTGKIQVVTPGGTAQSGESFTVLGPPPTFTFTPIHDAHVNLGSVTANYGTVNNLRVRASSYDAFLKFDLTSLTQAVQSARLRLYCTDESPDGGAIFLVPNNYRGTSTPWLEGGLNASNAPAIGAVAIAPSQVAGLNAWVEYDVTAAVAGGGIYSFGIRSGNTNSVYYNSKEAATNRPQLVVQTSTGPPTPPSVTSFSPSSGPVSTVVTIVGDGLVGTTGITFQGVAATAFTVDSPTRIRATVPAGATTGRIVVIHPQGTIQTATDFTVTGPPPIVTFEPIQDAQANSGSPASNYGSLNTIRTKTGVYESYLKFDVQGLTQPVLRARLRLFCTDDSPDGGAVYLVSNFYPGTSTPWVEGGLNWSNAPGIGGSPVAPSQAAGLNAWVEYDVTSAVTGNGAFSFGLRSGSTNSAYFSSKEGTNHPTLVVEVIPVASPSVTAFSPASGPAGTQVTLDGSAFAGVVGVTFNGAAASYIVDAPNRIRAIVPSGATTGRIAIRNGDGTGQSASDFSVIQTPTITSFTPGSGVTGTQITVRGTGFASATALTFNGTSAGFTAQGDTLVRALLPVGATSGPIGVTNPAGSATSSTSFTVLVRPVVTSLEPVSGAVGTEVTIRGSAFSAATAVAFHGIPATFTVDSDTLLRSTVPAGATTGRVVVDNPDGSGTSPMDFNVVGPPSIASFQPSSGAAGAEVTLRGTGFFATNAVAFNGTAATFTIVSDTLLRAIVAVGTSSGPIRVTNPVDSVTSVSSFTVITPPGITTFTPENGLVGSEVTVSGTSFAAITAMTFNGAAATFTIESDTLLRATVPAGAGSGPLRVTNPASFAVSSASFIVLMPPVVSSFAPASGPVGTLVTISGTGFAGVSGVTFNGLAAATVTVDSPIRIRATVPAGAATGRIAVGNADGTGQSGTDYVVTNPPSTLSFAPVQDAHAYSGSPTTNYGSLSTLRVKTNTDIYTCYLKFDVAGLSAPVQRAVLRLFVTDESPDGGTAYLVSNSYLGTLTPWIEGGLNWNNAPAIGSTLAGPAPGAAVPNTWLEFDVTSAVTGNNTVSFGIRSGHTNSVYFSSKESANPPSLVVITGTAAAMAGDAGARQSWPLGMDAIPEPLPLHLAMRSSPSPSRGRTTFDFVAPREGILRLTLFDVGGRSVRALSTMVGRAGAGHFQWDGCDARGQAASPGIYLYRFELGADHGSGRIVLQR